VPFCSDIADIESDITMDNPATVMATLAAWYATTAYIAELLDMDPDDKTEGCFKALSATAHRLPARKSWTYDKLLGISMESSAGVILADLDAAQGHRMIPWLRDFYNEMQDSDLRRGQ